MSLYCNYFPTITFIAAAVETASYGYGYEWAHKSSTILFHAIIPNKLLSLLIAIAALLHDHDSYNDRR